MSLVDFQTLRARAQDPGIFAGFDPRNRADYLLVWGGLVVALILIAAFGQGGLALGLAFSIAFVTAIIVIVGRK